MSLPCLSTVKSTHSFCCSWTVKSTHSFCYSWIFSSLPVNKQMLALSATYPESLAQHLCRYMREPTFVRLNPTDPGLIGEATSPHCRFNHSLINSLSIERYSFSPPLSFPEGLKQYYKLVRSHALPHKIFEEKVQNLLELFSKIPFNQALVFSNLHTRFDIFIPINTEIYRIHRFISHSCCRGVCCARNDMNYSYGGN